MRFFYVTRFRLLAGLLTLLFTGQDAVASDPVELRALAEQKLHESLMADSVYVRVHAAEALISEGLAQKARDSFLAEALAAEIVPIQRWAARPAVCAPGFCRAARHLAARLGWHAICSKDCLPKTSNVRRKSDGLLESELDARPVDAHAVWRSGVKSA